MLDCCMHIQHLANVHAQMQVNKFLVSLDKNNKHKKIPMRNQWIGRKILLVEVVLESEGCASGVNIYVKEDSLQMRPFCLTVSYETNFELWSRSWYSQTIS